MAAPEVAAASPGGHQEDSHGLPGAWRVVHTDDAPSGNRGVAVVTFAAGGVLTAEELPDGTLGLGAWRAEGDRFHARFFEAQAGSGSQPGTVVEIRPQGHLHNDRLSGTYTLTVRAAADDSVVAELTGRFTGTRIRA